MHKYRNAIKDLLRRNPQITALLGFAAAGHFTKELWLTGNPVWYIHHPRNRGMHNTLNVIRLVLGQSVLYSELLPSEEDLVDLDNVGVIIDHPRLSVEAYRKMYLLTQGVNWLPSTKASIRGFSVIVTSEEPLEHSLPMTTPSEIQAVEILRRAGIAQLPLENGGWTDVQGLHAAIELMETEKVHRDLMNFEINDLATNSMERYAKEFKKVTPEFRNTVCPVAYVGSSLIIDALHGDASWKDEVKEALRSMDKSTI